MHKHQYKYVHERTHRYIPVYIRESNTQHITANTNKSYNKIRIICSTSACKYSKAATARGSIISKDVIHMNINFNTIFRSTGTP